MKNETMITENFFTNQQIGQLSIATRLFLIGLHTLADEEGYVRCLSLKRIDAQIFPYDNYDISNGIIELERHGFIHTDIKPNYILICLIDNNPPF